MLDWNNVCQVLYKGGHIESKMWSFWDAVKNIQGLWAAKATSLDPLGELREHYAILHRHQQSGGIENGFFKNH